MHQVNLAFPCTHAETLAATQCEASGPHLYAQDQLISVLSVMFVSLHPHAEAQVDGKACPASPDHNVPCPHLC